MTKQKVLKRLEIDSLEMVVRISLAKVDEIVKQVMDILAKQKVNLRYMQSLIGSLYFACRVITPDHFVDG